ncbi:MAG: four helix bundle protein [Bacteroidetes bacterium]|nr:four helix bundle protein [Bacteroidota bacterium]MBU1679522.1 four helix bundle protein [Bacteroidota bacterium]
MHESLEKVGEGKIEKSKHIYDLKERTFQFAKRARIFVKSLPKSIANIEDSKQLVRSSGSVGPNYIEANESLGKKDFLMRLKISLKECKESGFWLKLINETNHLENQQEIDFLLNETIEFKKIFSTIIIKSS